MSNITDSQLTGLQPPLVKRTAANEGTIVFPLRLSSCSSRKSPSSAPGKYCDLTPVGLDSTGSSRGVTCGVGFKSSNSTKKGWGCFLPDLSSPRKLQLMMSHLESTLARARPPKRNCARRRRGTHDHRWAWGVTCLQKLDTLKVVFMQIMNHFKSPLVDS